MATANITDGGRRRRLTGGMVWLVIGALGTAALAALHVRQAWYTLLVLPFALAALGYFQAKERT